MIRVPQKGKKEVTSRLRRGEKTTEQHRVSGPWRRKDAMNQPTKGGTQSGEVAGTRGNPASKQEVAETNGPPGTGGETNSPKGTDGGEGGPVRMSSTAQSSGLGKVEEASI